MGIRNKHGLWPVLAFGLLLGCRGVPARPVALPASAAGVTVSLDAATGAYTIATRAPAWTFKGATGTALSDVKQNSGHDRIGDYQELTFRWTAAVPMSGAIRNYKNRPAVLFAVTNAQATANPQTPFPNFTKFPPNLHPMSYADGVFSPHRFGLEQTSTPWVLFDDAANTVVVSSANHFMISKMVGDGKASIGSDLNAKLATLPAGFTHQTLLVAGPGIGGTLETWGRALTDMYGKVRPANDADPLLKRFGYWTDNGADYYYNYDPARGYAGTLAALRTRYQQENIPLGYLQLDSWWYQKSLAGPDGKLGGPKNPRLPQETWNRYGGTLDYSASPALFPGGLAPFQKSLGLPLVVHARWIDPQSPYHQNYRISGVAATDPRWWDDRAAYLAQSGIFCYEQDWLNEIYAHSPEMASTPDAGDAFTDNMARASKNKKMTMQYCMATPRFFLQGAKYGNLTTIRTSGDRFERGKWNDFVYTSALASALGMWPWADVFMSGETENMLLATLSAGPVGTGDALGKESRANIMRAIRQDGVIIKPDTPLVPTDAGILADAQGRHTPLVAWTHTDHGALRTAYVFAFTRKGDGTGVTFTPSALGLTAPIWVYDVSNKAARLLQRGQSYETTVGPTGTFYGIVAPVTRSGVAFLGDANTFVSTGRQRVPALKDQPSGLTATIAFAAGESSVTLHGYAPSAPSVSVHGGKSAPVAYDAATRHFSVVVAPTEKRQTVDVTFSRTIH